MTAALSMSSDFPMQPDAEHEKRVKEARPKPVREWLATSALLVGIVCFGIQLSLIRREIRDSALAEKAPISYVGKFAPNKPVYHPGETAVFRFERKTTFPEEYLYVIGLSSFDNLDSGMNYNAGIGIRKVRQKAGDTYVGYTVKQIPADAKPGKRYVLEGLAMCQTTHRTQPVGFESEPFEIRSWESERERAEQEKYDRDHPLNLPTEEDGLTNEPYSGPITPSEGTFVE